MNSKAITPLTSTPSEPIRFLLPERTSCDFSELGGECFVVVAKAMREGEAGRWALHLIPADLQLANKAVRVALGTMRAAAVAKPRSRPSQP